MRRDFRDAGRISGNSRQSQFKLTPRLSFCGRGRIGGMAPRYSLRDMFILTTLIAVAIVGFQWTDILDRRVGWFAATVVGLISMASLGAAVGTLFHRKAIWAASLVGIPVVFWAIVILLGSLLHR